MFIWRKPAIGFIICFVLALCGIYLWYDRLDYSHKRYIQNILKQLPYLPGRYEI